MCIHLRDKIVVKYTLKKSFNAQKKHNLCQKLDPHVPIHNNNLCISFAMLCEFISLIQYSVRVLLLNPFVLEESFCQLFKEKSGKPLKTFGSQAT